MLLERIKSKSFSSPSTLSFSRTHLQQVAEENTEICQKGKYLNKKGDIVEVTDALALAIKNTKHYHYQDELKPPTVNESHETRVHICFAMCVKAALALEKHGGKHVGVLNSAHGTTPGGKYGSGCLSQEACLCRGSLLYATLTQFQNKPNTIYTINTQDEFQLSPSSCAIFSPKVPVHRRDAFEAQLLEGHRECSFVSLPPPNAFELGDDEVVRKALREHLYRALCIFAIEGCVDLVLCSYGCGTRGNDPKMVAEVYEDLLSNDFKGVFHTILISINPKKDHEYDAFSSVFQQS